MSFFPTFSLPVRTSAVRSIRDYRPLGAVLLSGLLGCPGCSNLPASGPQVAASNCDTNADYAMTGVVHAATKRSLDECRRGPTPRRDVVLSQRSPQP